MYNFDTYNEFSEFVNGLKEESVKKDAFAFLQKFPYVGKEDSLKLISLLKRGKPLEDLIESFRLKQKQRGWGIKERDYKAIYQLSDVIDDMIKGLRTGKEKGTTTYIDQLDFFWKWRRKEFNIWSGYTGEGKTQFLIYLSLIKAIKENCKIAFFSPENYPPEEFFDDMIHTLSGYSTDKDNPNFIGEERYMKMYNKIKDNFFFVYVKPPENDLITILKEFSDLIINKDVSVCVIDPLMKVQRPVMYAVADDKYANYVTTICSDFCREYNVSLHLVMHQITPKKLENGQYPKPDKYTAKGGGSWAEGCDNFLTVWRPNFGQDYLDNLVMVSAKKIKKPKLVGTPGDWNIRFNRKTNRYVDEDSGLDLFDFDSELNIGRLQVLNFKN
jgi:hypothetical protein